jgi:hypothetical protein
MLACLTAHPFWLCPILSGPLSDGKLNNLSGDFETSCGKGP